MIMFEENEADSQCFLKAKSKNEPTFTLRAQDASSVPVLNYWLQLNPQLPPAKRSEALKKMEMMRAWPVKKKAD